MNKPSIFNVKQQVFNITLALYKVTERISTNEPLRARLREKGIELMIITQDVFSGKIINSDIHTILKQEFDNISFLLEFGRFYASASINPTNFSVLIQSYQALWENIDNLMASLEDSPEESLQKLLSDIKDPIASTDAPKFPQETENKNDSAEKAIQEQEEVSIENIDQNKNVDLVKNNYRNTAENNSGLKNYSGKQITRQQKIINILKEKSMREFQLKDILTEFPNFNEKTVRNDLKTLCESGILKRQGAGRSSTYQVIRKISAN